MRRLVILFLALVCAGWLQAQTPSGGYTAPTITYSGPNGAYRAQGSQAGNGVVLTVTDTTIVASFNTPSASTSTMTCGGNAAKDNSTINSTAHLNVVTGLTPNTGYSCSGTAGTFNWTGNATTKVAATRTAIQSASLGSTTATTVHGDTPYTFVSNDNNTYITGCDSNGYVINTPNAGANMLLSVVTNETTGSFNGTLSNLLTNYLGINTSSGTDGPSGDAMVNKLSGLFGMEGNLYIFANRQLQGAYFNNVIMSTNKGTSWNNYQQLSTFNANGNPINTATFPLPSNTYGWVSPIRYGPDDGTLGYNTAGNQIDGANAFVYSTFVVSPFTVSAGQGTPAYLMRQPRVHFAAQDYTGIQYWIGTCGAACGPTDFVNDSNWSSSDSSKVAIINPSPTVAWPVVTFVPGVNRYILTANAEPYPDSTHYTFFFWEAATPVGPWKLIYTDGGNVQEWYGPVPFHRDVYTNSATNNVPVRLMFSGAENTFTTTYYPTFATLTLSTTVTTNNFVQGNGSTTAPSGASSSLAYSSNVTNGDLLAVAWRGTISNNASSVQSTCTTGNWNIVYNSSADGNGSFGGWAWAFATSSAACTVTVNWSTNDFAPLAVAEYSGPTVGLRTSSAFAAGDSTTPTSSGITAASNDLLIGVGEMNAGETSWTAGSGYTVRAQGAAGGSRYVAIEDNLSTTGGSGITASFTVPTSGFWTAGIGAFH